MIPLFQSLKKCDLLYQPSITYLSVRWATKPRWVPKAKTKIFRVPQRPVVPPEETAELKKLYAHYRTHMKSIKKLFNEIHRANETSAEVLQRLEQEKEDDWKKCLKLNDEWNRRIAIERAQRDAEDLEKELEEVREKIKIKEEKERERMENLEEIIREEKEASKYYITENNIDEVLNKILNSPPHTFNFAIDIEGRKYSGFNSTPDVISESENHQDEQNKESFHG